jgi:exopolyphosphatase/guanosine-5'-triphosphate,3'-diphosphate pyrophosphatase
MQIYDGLDSLGLIPARLLPDARFLLESAAVAHDVGLHAARKKHQLGSYKMIRELNPSPGWNAGALRTIALIARFHRGALPRIEQRAFSGLPADQRKAIVLLSSILRLADALDYPHQRRVRQLVFKRTAEVIRIFVPEYTEYDASAEMLAAARHLLETACRLPIMIQRL